MSFQEQASNEADNGDLVFENSSVSETDELEEIRAVLENECIGFVAQTPAIEQVNELSNLDTTKEDEVVLKFEEVSLDGSSSVEDGPGYKSLIHPSNDTQDSDEESASGGEETNPSSSSDSSEDSSSSSNYTSGSSEREDSEDDSQDLRLRPKKITLSYDLRETSSDADSDVVGILRRDRTNPTSTDNTFNSCNDVTQISSGESLSVLTDSSASEFKGSDREDSVPLSSGSTSTKSTTDIESGGIKDTRKRNRGGLAAGFVSLLGLGRFWLSPAKAKCRVRYNVHRSHVISDTLLVYFTRH